MSDRSLNIALKEWDVVRDSLRSGRQIILLRKGGIADRGGQFALEHDRFLIFPTFVHQDYKMLKAEAHSRFQPCASEPDWITIETLAEVMDVVPVTSRSKMDALYAEHVWSPALIDMRFNYRPNNPLYLLIVRTYVLPEPVIIDNTPAYAGCKSWVPLEQPIEIAGAREAFSDAEFEFRRDTVCTELPPHLRDRSNGR